MTMNDLVTTTTSIEAETWAQAFLAWQAGLSGNTQRSYRVAWQSLLAFAEAMPWTVSRADLARWVDGMRGKGQSAATIRQRVAAISSFFRYVGADFTIRKGDREEPLFAGANPAGARVLRPRLAAFQGAHYLGVEECQALLRAIRSCTGVQAQRDYALFLAYLILGRRNSEIRLLRWGDLETTDGRTWYRWSGKGHEAMRTELPSICLEAIRGYLEAAGRSLAKAQSSQRGEGIEIGKDEFIFTAINANARRLPGGSGWKSGGPLSARQVGKLLKKYCVLAGLDPGRVHVHTLRHSAAMLRKSAGDNVEQIRDFLVHSSLSITQVYLHTLEGSGDSSWGKVADLLGLRTERGGRMPSAPTESTIPPVRRRSNKRS
jgi:integrase